jgi:predicted ATP-dependent protease
MPERNRDALMLRGDVVDAIAAGRFHVYAISTVEEGIELLTGVPAGVPDEDGHYPERTVFRAVETRLKRFHQAMGEVYRAGGSR